MVHHPLSRSASLLTTRYGSVTLQKIRVKICHGFRMIEPIDSNYASSFLLFSLHPFVLTHHPFYLVPPFRTFETLFKPI